MRYSLLLSVRLAPPDLQTLPSHAPFIWDESFCISFCNVHFVIQAEEGLPPSAGSDFWSRDAVDGPKTAKSCCAVTVSYGVPISIMPQRASSNYISSVSTCFSCFDRTGKSLNVTGKSVCKGKRHLLCVDRGASLFVG